MTGNRKEIVIDLQERDKVLLVDLFESRIMTLEHIALLHFEGREEATKKRVQKLKAAGFIAARPRRSTEPSILHLTRKGLKLLLSEGLLDRFPLLGGAEFEKRATVSDVTVRHELDVMSVKAAMVAAIRQTDRFCVAEFSTWPRLHQFNARPPTKHGTYSKESLIKPDGFSRIHEREADGGLSEHLFFLEVDRSTEAQGRLAAKAACYISYYRNGGFALRHGHKREEFQTFPFRVLMVFKTEERRDNTARSLLSMHPPILTQVWLTTFAELIERPFDGIWVRPCDYREAALNYLSTSNIDVDRRDLARGSPIDQLSNRRKLLSDSA